MLQEKYSTVIEKNQKYIDEAMNLREKQAGMMEQVNNAKEASVRYQEMTASLQKQGKRQHVLFVFLYHPLTKLCCCSFLLCHNCSG